MKRLIALTALVVVSLIANNAQAATVIADWTFEVSIPLGTGTMTGVLAETGTGSASASHANANAQYSNPVGNGSVESFSANAWAINDYYQFQTSTTGFQALSINWDQTNSATGPRDFIVRYSLDGTNFTTLGAQYTVLSTANFWTASTQYPEYNTTRSSLTTSLENQANVYFRLVDNTTTSSNGGSVAAGGTNRVDNFTVLGVTALASPHYWNGGGSGGGSGTWNTSNTNWNTLPLAAGTSQAFDSSKAAVFANNAGTVTISGVGGVTANGGLQFDINGFTITGTTLTLGTINAIQVTQAADSATINAPVAGTNGMTISGSGTVVLGTANSFSNGVTINGATLSVSNDNQLGDSGNDILINTGTLKVTANVGMGSGRDLTIANSGTIDVASATTLTVAGATNGGDVTLSNSGKVVLAGSTKSPGRITFSKDGTLQFGDGTATGLVSGNIQSSADSGTATLNGAVNFGSTQRSIAVNNANATLVVTGGLTSAGQLNVIGSGTIDLRGDDSALSNATVVQIGNTGAAGPRVIVHDGNSLGNAGQANFNSGTIYAANAVTFGTAWTTSFGSASTAANQFTNKYDGANMTFLGAVHLFNNNTLDTRITVNNTTTFAGGWAASTGTTASPSVVINGTAAGVLALGGTILLDKPVAVQTATVDVNGTMTNAAATFLITNSGRVRNGITDALPTAGSVTVGTTGLSTTLAASTGTYSLNGHNQTLGTVQLIGGSITGSGTLTATSANYDARDGLISAQLAGSKGLVKSTGVFTNTVTLSGNNSYTGGTTVSAGKLIVAHSHGLGNSNLTILVGATTQMQAGLTAPLQLDLLAIAGNASPTATMDITDNNLIVHNGNITTMTAQAATAFNGFAWNGLGLTSTTARDDGSGNTALGVIQNDDGGGSPVASTWPTGADSGGGVSVSLTDVLVKYTYYGDANLDGVVDSASDFDFWSSGNTGNGTGWEFGDFDYNGTVDAATDFDLWSGGVAAYQGNGPLGGVGGVGGGVQPVPEPSTMVLAALGLAGVAAFARRRRVKA